MSNFDNVSATPSDNGKGIRKFSLSKILAATKNAASEIPGDTSQNLSSTQLIRTSISSNIY
jgi:hypothetical protein